MIDEKRWIELTQAEDEAYFKGDLMLSLPQGSYTAEEMWDILTDMFRATIAIQDEMRRDFESLSGLEQVRIFDALCLSGVKSPERWFNVVLAEQEPLPDGSRACVLARCLAAPGLGLLQLVHVVVVVAEEGARRLHVAHARELQAEVDAAALALGLELGDLAAQLLGRLGVLGRLGHLGLERRDLLVALGDGLPVVGAGVAAHLLLGLRAFLLLLLLRLGLRTLRGFLAAIGLTVHVNRLSRLSRLFAAL